MSITRHTIANMVGTILPMFAALIAVPFYLQALSPERYGVFILLISLTQYLVFLDFGLARALTQKIAQTQDTKAINALIWSSLHLTTILSLLAALVVFTSIHIASGKLISESSELLHEVEAAAPWLSAVVPCLLISGVLSSVLNARLSYVALNSINSATGVLVHAVPLALIYLWEASITSLAIGIISVRAAGVAALLIFCVTKLDLTKPERPQAKLLTKLLRYGGWFSLLGIIGPLLTLADRWLIGSRLGTSHVAHYTVPFDLVSRATVVSGSLGTALFPRMASMTDDIARSLSFRASKTISSLLTPLFLIGLPLFDSILALWVGRDFADQSTGVGETIIIGLWLNSIIIPFHSQYLARHGAKVIVVIYLLELPIYLLFLWVSVEHIGVLGAAIAWTLRVILDFAILARLNGVLRELITSAAPSLTALITVYILVITNFPGKIGSLTAASLLAATLIFRDWQLISLIARKSPESKKNET